jgi:hypothetical protein
MTPYMLAPAFWSKSRKTLLDQILLPTRVFRKIHVARCRVQGCPSHQTERNF